MEQDLSRIRVFKGEEKRKTVTFLGFMGERDLSFYDSPLGKRNSGSYDLLGEERGTGDRRVWEGQKILLLRPFQSHSV